MSMNPQQPITNGQSTSLTPEGVIQFMQQMQGAPQPGAEDPAQMMQMQNGEIPPELLQQLMMQQQQFQDMNTNVQGYPQQAEVPPDLIEVTDEQLMSMLQAFDDTISFYQGLLTRTELSVEVQVNAISTTATTLKTFVETLQLMQGATPVQEASQTPGV